MNTNSNTNTPHRDSDGADSPPSDAGGMGDINIDSDSVPGNNPAQENAPPPTTSWLAQRKTKLLLGGVAIVVAAIAVVLGVTLSSSSSNNAPTPVVVPPPVVEQTESPSEPYPSVVLPTTGSPTPSPSLRTINIDTPLTQTPSQSPNLTRFESLKIVPDDGAADDRFGKSVAIFGGTLVVGALLDDDKGDQSGSAYIYHQDPETKEWILQQKLVPDDGAAYDYFGESVAIYDNTIVVGAKWDGDKGEWSGSAYIYHQDPETNEWIFQQKLVPDDGAAYDYFGVSVAIYNGTLVVGATRDDDKGENSGSVYIYHQDPETKEWIFQQKLVADDGAAYDHFGFSVAIFGNTLVVGAHGDDDKRTDDKGQNSGSAYIYHLDTETKEWILQKKLLADDGEFGDEFGWSVSIFEDTLVVGAPGGFYSNDYSGSAYIYHQDPQTKEWILQQKLVADDGAADDNFGFTVAIYGDTLVVGAPYDDDDKGEDSGSSYIYHKDSDTKEWTLQRKFVPDDGAAEDYFGGWVAIYDSTIVVASSADDDKGADSGSVYVYS